MISIAIVEDDPRDLQRLEQLLTQALNARKMSCCIKAFDDADQFLFSYTPSYDIVFMDIMLGKGMNGMDAARRLRQIDCMVLLVFVTSMVQMAVEGYEVDALDFILKPVEQYSFGLKLNRILSRIGPGREAFVQIHEGGRAVKLRVQLINYVQVDGHYVEYHSREGLFRQYMTLSAAEQGLNDPCFYRCNRSCLVNLRHVSDADAETCTVDGEKLPIARTQRERFHRAFAEYLNGLRR